MSADIEVNDTDIRVTDSEGTIGVDTLSLAGQSLKEIVLPDNVIRVSWGGMTQDINAPAFGDVVITFPTI